MSTTDRRFSAVRDQAPWWRRLITNYDDCQSTRTFCRPVAAVRRSPPLSPASLGTIALTVLLVAATAAGEEPVNFNRDIRPLLATRCFGCHGPGEENRKAGLRLDLRDAATRELDSGETAVVPGDVEASALVERITSDDEDLRMPPADSDKEPLSDKDTALVRRWIQQGAPYTGHWAFVPPTRPDVPVITPSDDWTGASAPRNAIDAFIRERLVNEGLRPMPEADRRALIRRVTLDLTGLPPTLPEVEAFLADRSPGAYERVVDRLLASPRYGEHMARYWLDLARYGDTHGLHLDNERQIWPYRDWVIRAFRRNLPYDRFTIEQLAGDLLPDPTREQLIATGFCRCNVSTNEGGSIEEEVYVRNNVDRVETMSTVFLGLAGNCAVCHDHKYDPLTQKEFYQFFAFFNNNSEHAMDGNALQYPPVIPLPSAEQQAQKSMYEARLADIRGEIQRALAECDYQDPGPDVEETSLEQDGTPFRSFARWLQVSRTLEKPPVPDDVADAIKREADQQTDAQRKRLREYFLEFVCAQTRPTFDPLHREEADVQKQLGVLDAAIPRTMIMQERDEPRQAYLLIRGQYDQRGDPVGRALPAWLPPLPEGAPMNRLGLAQWLVCREHPLTARVAVNRFWQQLFGTGIVATSEDFGAQGEWPSHPELLDWLAVEFREGGWDVQRLMKLMVMSGTYRQSSHVSPGLASRDPQNRLLARGPRFRMDAEMIRDQALFVSGLLVERIGGKGVKPYQPPGLWKAVGYTSSNTANFVQDRGDALYRRSLYTFWKRTSPPPAMSILDAPTREACTARRPRTNTPLAALALLNDVQFVEAARHLAQRAMTEGGATTDDRIRYMFGLVASRLPTDRELSVLREQHDWQLVRFEDHPDAAEMLLSQGESPRDESLSAPDHAAWAMVANLMLNLDEVLNK